MTHTRNLTDSRHSAVLSCVPATPGSALVKRDSSINFIQCVLNLFLLTSKLVLTISVEKNPGKGEAFY